ncbi:hypothetical protein PFICI_05807 [Pestalotiopsis fici W106-1]|uniref:Uncharacterized protein n=1 Tax=Pestalotiopsis fici (strain W106-1 / CGMCC3.15140) TaxID=1229662 RepID=W3XFD9_PESFW|nr:uncharacterized protein PFICI_05807 [Pestalotiopsis fici W106-1]ETS83931.1 hypothetical protein PFICI_05807 [Pestalotiopsis fici W106-1]
MVYHNPLQRTMNAVLIDFCHICQPELMLEYELDTVPDNGRSKTCRRCSKTFVESVSFTNQDQLEKQLARLAAGHFATSHGLAIASLGPARLEKIEIRWKDGDHSFGYGATSLLGMEPDRFQRQLDMIPLRGFIDVIYIEFKSPSHVHPGPKPLPAFPSPTTSQVSYSPRVTYPNQSRGPTGKSKLDQPWDGRTLHPNLHNPYVSPKIRDVFMSDFDPSPTPVDAKPFCDHTRIKAIPSNGFRTSGSYEINTGTARRTPLQPGTKKNHKAASTDPYRKASSNLSKHLAQPLSNPFCDGLSDPKPQTASILPLIHHPHMAPRHTSQQQASNHHVPSFGDGRASHPSQGAAIKLVPHPNAFTGLSGDNPGIGTRPMRPIKRLPRTRKPYSGPHNSFGADRAGHGHHADIGAFTKDQQIEHFLGAWDGYAGSDELMHDAS